MPRKLMNYGVNGTQIHDYCYGINWAVSNLTYEKKTMDITVTWLLAQWRLKPPASRLFTQAFVQANIKENTKAPHHWPLWGESTGYRWIPRTKGQLPGKMFPFDDVIMTSTWNQRYICNLIYHMLTHKQLGDWDMRTQHCGYKFPGANAPDHQ